MLDGPVHGQRRLVYQWHYQRQHLVMDSNKGQPHWSPYGSVYSRKEVLCQMTWQSCKLLKRHLLTVGSRSSSLNLTLETMQRLVEALERTVKLCFYSLYLTAEIMYRLALRQCWPVLGYLLGMITAVNPQRCLSLAFGPLNPLNTGGEWHLLPYEWWCSWTVISFSCFIRLFNALVWGEKLLKRS